MFQSWDFNDPLHNAVGGDNARTAVVLPLLLCPSDELPAIRVSFRTWRYALTSYGGNGGRRSFNPNVATTDGIFHTTGPGSLPAPNQCGVAIRDVTDGTANTLLFGERNHRDPALTPSPIRSEMAEWGWWGAATGRLSPAT